MFADKRGVPVRCVGDFNARNVGKTAAVHCVI